MEGGKSFYSLDYIIELGEKRMEQYSTAYQLTLGRTTNIIVVYSAVGIYLIPIVQDFGQKPSVVFEIETIVLVMILSCSLFYAIRLLIPANLAYLKVSSEYYQDMRLQYEQKMLHQEMSDSDRLKSEQKIDDFIKTAYIDEPAWGQQNNWTILTRKSLYYQKALVCGLLAILPYIVCVSYHISAQKAKTEKQGKTSQKIIKFVDTIAKNEGFKTR
ncbi:MAG TPA: hypothetical protein VGQ51_17160 [Puia sp.]|jgi:hypothetical protein|nr:hypothetical protein [Puia sp.]